MNDLILLSLLPFNFLVADNRYLAITPEIKIQLL